MIPTEGGEHIFITLAKNEENSCQQASNINSFERNYGDSKNELKIMIAKQPQIEKVSQTHTGATFLLIFTSG